MSFDLLRPLSELGPALHLDPEELNDQIEIHGTGGELRKGMLCPCRPVGRVEPRLGCETCKGVGYFYPEELREPVCVLGSTRRAKQAETMAGRHWSGTMQLTFPTGFIPTRGDMLLPDDEMHVVLQILRRAIEEEDPADYRHEPYTAERWQVDKPPSGGVPKGWEFLLYSGKIEVEAVAWQQKDGAISRSLIADPSIYFVEERRIRWKPGCGPEPGQGYAVRYRAPAAYMLGDSHPVLRVEGNRPMPHVSTAERLDRWGDPDIRE